MLTEVLRYLRNFFIIKGKEKRGNFTIENGNISLSDVQEGQYILIEGSVFNDGVKKYGAGGLKDEAFYGRVCPLAVPSELVSIAEEITAYCATQGATGPYQSESFGGYSYTRMMNSEGNAASWIDVYKSRLSIWKKI